MHGRLQGTEAAALYSHVLSRVSPKVLQKTNNQETRSCVHCVKEGLGFLGEGLLICGSEHLESADDEMRQMRTHIQRFRGITAQVEQETARVVENFAGVVEKWKISPWW